MRAVGLAVAIIGLAALSAGIVASGKTIGGTDIGNDVSMEVDEIPLEIIEDEDIQSNAPVDDDRELVASVDLPAAPTVASTLQPVAGPAPVDEAAETPPTPGVMSAARAVAPAVIAPPAMELGSLERLEPRQPLSKLALALPPKPLMPADWKGTVLRRPVATGSARFEAMGYQVAIAGTDGVEADERCTYEGTSWNCGVRARTAFRLFLRGRAPTCAVPPQADREVIMADCRIGKQDIGLWLVENGWARATPGGPYVEAEAAAKTAGKGIFGGPPKALHAAQDLGVTIAPAEFVSPIDPLERSAFRLTHILSFGGNLRILGL